MAGARVLAVIICAALSLVIGLIASDYLPGRLSELLAMLPVLFLEYIANLLTSRTFTLPGSAADIFQGRVWYLAAPGYAALVNFVLDLAYAVVRAISDSVALLALLDIIIGVAMGLVIGRREAPHPVATVVATGYSARLLGGLLDVLVLGWHQFETIHDGGSLGAVIMLNGALFAGAGLAGFAAFRGREKSRAAGPAVPDPAQPERDGPKGAMRRITASDLSGALVMLILAVGSGYAIVSLASIVQPATRLYSVNRPLSSADGIVVTLTRIKVTALARPSSS